jgi:hypothetical protein
MALPKFILMKHLLNDDSRLQYYQYLNIRNWFKELTSGAYRPTSMSFASKGFY